MLGTELLDTLSSVAQLASSFSNHSSDGIIRKQRSPRDAVSGSNCPGMVFDRYVDPKRVSSYSRKDDVPPVQLQLILSTLCTVRLPMGKEDAELLDRPI